MRSSVTSPTQCILHLHLLYFFAIYFISFFISISTLTTLRGVARNIVTDPRLVPGGGAIEMAVSQALVEKSKSIEGVEQYPYRAVAAALEVCLDFFDSFDSFDSLYILLSFSLAHLSHSAFHFGSMLQMRDSLLLLFFHR